MSRKVGRPTKKVGRRLVGPQKVSRRLVAPGEVGQRLVAPRKNLGASSSFGEVPQQQLCSYQIVQTLGEGAFGEVLLIVDRDNPSCAVAMKKMSIADGDAEKIKQIRKEALVQKMLSKVGNDHIIRLIGMKNDSQWYYIFLEYADGGELFDKIEPDVGMPSYRAQFYFRQLISGLEYIHGNGVVHRDIKPENLLLTSRHVLKISDFGMATIFRHNGQERLLDMSCGTLPYAAPEIIAGGKYKAQPVDIWSSGIVLITMLTGEIPWEKANDSSSAYLNWLSNVNLDEAPWNKVDVRGLSFLRVIVTDKIANRATIEKIKNHPWFTHNYGCVVDDGLPIKRQRLANDEIENIPCTQIPAESKNLEDLKSRHRQVERKVSSFSQPANIDDMFLTQQIDMSQGSGNLMQRMVCRMTRFCVKVGMNAAIQRVSTEAEYAGYSVRQQSHMFNLLITYREISMMVCAYEMVNSAHGGTKVMIDFRRSRGDGIQFKRMFIEIRNRMHDLICSEGNYWLQNRGLFPSQEPEFANSLPTPLSPSHQ
ncbi:unnamed protein product [Caenorhabditis angaria]|uniref:non-specific serine/threonine protein kinase n=1 Tax=Caenorhabditis angaria TaxID=860376 RepID=A0A9P1IV32_9PELO|nr:unnamed protein product [Caenorhabditis angaria]